MRHHYARHFFIFGILALLSLVASAPADSEDLPNIVVIMADDLGWKDLHCYGNKLVDTVNLDRLAEQGMRFTHGYAASPVCTPTRAAMMTGMSPARLAITNHAPGNGENFSLPGTGLQEAQWNTFLGLQHVTIAQRLQDAGYATGFVGKWHLSHRKGEDTNGKLELQLRPEHQGFDINVGGGSNGGPPSYFSPYRIPALKDGPTGEYLPERLADECITFVKKNKGKPFFLAWWDYSVHYPFQAPEELIEKYKKKVGPGIANPTYAAMIEGMDLAIGRFLTALDAEGVAENTLVIFTSDNGAFQADISPLRGEKGYLYEGGIRVPWIVRWPGHVKSGSTCATPIISTDTFPTLLEVAGLEADADKPLDGVSIVPLLEQTGELGRDSIYFHYPNYAFHKQNRLGSAIREGQHKLILHYDDGSVELYNLNADIGEEKNLASEQPELAGRLRKKLDEWLLETGAKLPVRVATP
jgi:arylsulfatase A